MEKKTRKMVIWGVALLLVVTVALLGLTYAYYRTQIKPNESDKSISIETAELRLIYGDGNAAITVTGLEPGGEIGTKAFTVTSQSTRNIDYGVYLENVINTFSRTQDVTYTLTCTSNVDGNTCSGVTQTTYPTVNSLLVSNTIAPNEVHTYVLSVNYAEANVDQSIDMGSKISGKVQIHDKDVASLMLTAPGARVASIGLNNNSIRENTNAEMISYRTFADSQQTGVYNFVGLEAGDYTLTYYDSEGISLGTVSNISITKGDSSSFNGKNAVYTETEKGLVATLSNGFVFSFTGLLPTNPFNSGTLAYNIFDNASTSANGTTLTGAIANLGRSKSGANDKYLATIAENNGTSYYFRGSVQDNYVTFNNMCFRAVRIDNSGNVKLILAGAGDCSSLSADSGMMRVNNGVISRTYSNLINTELSNWFNNNGFSSVVPKLVNYNWCLDDRVNGYDLSLYSSTASLGTASSYATGITAALKGTVSDLKAAGTSFTYRGVLGIKADNNRYVSLDCSSESGSTKGSYIGMLTAQEVVMAGANYGNSQSAYYLADNAQVNATNSGIKGWWTLTYDTFDGSDDSAVIIWDDYSLGKTGINTGIIGARPVIVLSNSATVTSGNGTEQNPYVIS